MTITNPKTLRPNRPRLVLPSGYSTALYLQFLLASIGAVLLFRTIGLSKKANKISRENSNEQLRAYVGVESIVLDCPSAVIPNYIPAPIVPGERIKDFVILNVKNYGATPANKLHTWVNWFVAPFPQELPPDFTYPDVSPQLPPNVTIGMIDATVFPSETFRSKIAMLDVNPVILSHRRLVLVYYYGRIAYTDMTNTPRFTYFCYKHDVVGGNIMEPHGPHNYAT